MAASTATATSSSSAATNPSLEIAKAGWLYRRSSVLHRWKKNWFVLYRDGVLRYFESPDCPRAEEVYVVRSAFSRVRIGKEVDSVHPPEEVSNGKDCLLELEMRDGSNLILCAESVDDMKAWQYALEEARTMPGVEVRTVPIRMTPLYDPYYYYGGGYPGRVISAPATAQVIQMPNGTTTVIPAGQVVYVDDVYPYGRRYYDDYSGLGTGFLTGALVGSALMWPFFWFC